MTREIKFRVWNKDYKEMWSWHNVKQSTLFRLVEEGENLTFMQFTGLRDKNGKEIYEGDIVEEWIFPSETRNGTTRFFIHNGKISNKGVVEYNEKEACFSPKGIKGFWYMKLNELEVIGNIYENEDLLP